MEETGQIAQGLIVQSKDSGLHFIGILRQACNYSLLYSRGKLESILCDQSCLESHWW
jgi:hypothetical protein